MDSSTGLRTLNSIITPLNLRLRPPFLPPFHLSPSVKKLNFSLSSSSRSSPLCSLPEGANGSCLPNGVGEEVRELSQNKVLQVVLVSPQIPGNTGCIARTCAASAVGLHLVGPLGFQVDDAKLKRAGLDYWPYVVVKVHTSWAEFRKYFSQQDGEKRLLAFTKRGTETHSIPGNTGCIARTCAASAVGLHLVGPLGFQVDDAKLKRAGLDYWPYVVVKVHSSRAEFRKYFSEQDGEKRLLAFTKRGTETHSDFSYRRGDWLVFGSEVSGLPPEALLDCKSEELGGGTLRIPMVDTYVRCLNLSVSVGIALYEASRQLNYEQLQLHEETKLDGGDKSFIVEDVFA